MPLQAGAAANVRELAALALIPFPWQQLNFQIVFLAPRTGYRAMTFPAQHRIEIYARPNDSAQMLAYDIAHELGHAVDLTFNSEEKRLKWMEARGINPKTPWFGCDACADAKTPAGDFAETFAFLLLGPGHFTARIAPPPTAEQIPALRTLLPERFMTSRTAKPKHP